MISKSSYVKFIECPNSLWLHFNKPEEEKELDDMVKQNIEEGNAVGELARSYFDDTFNASVVDKNGTPNYSEQIKLTKEGLKNNRNAIAEASFLIDDLFCAVDILKKDDDGYSIYEVKSSGEIKNKQLIDVSYQRYILEKYGLKVNHIYLMHPNKEYIFHEKLDLNEYFKIECVDQNEIVLNNYANIDKNITSIKNLIHSSEPKVDFKKECDKCGFKAYCTRNLPKDRIDTLCGISSGAYEFYKNGIYTIKEYIETPKYKKAKKNNRREVQIRAVLDNKKEPIINKEKIKEFLDSLKYPICHLDFETTIEVIPSIEGHSPYQSFPYQYSLHIEYEDGRVEHKEYLADKADCTRELALSLIKDFNQCATMLSFHSSTENNIIEALAKQYPDLSDDLLKIVEKSKDLLVPFTKGYYYDPKQGGLNSIKVILPALCPNMKNAYHNLSVVHKGDEALIIFFKMLELKEKDNNEYERIRKGMLEYCELDTKSMVEILAVLRKSIDY